MEKIEYTDDEKEIVENLEGNSNNEDLIADSELVKIKAQQEFLSKLFSEDSNISLETTDLEENMIGNFALMHDVDSFLQNRYNFQVNFYRQFAIPFYSLRKSKRRESRKEVIEGIRSLGGNNVNTDESSSERYQSGRIKRFFFGH